MNMPAMRICGACDGPVPRASHRCPWCRSEIESLGRRPEHLFSTFDGQGVGRRILPPPDFQLPGES